MATKLKFAQEYIGPANDTDNSTYWVPAGSIGEVVVDRWAMAGPDGDDPDVLPDCVLVNLTVQAIKIKGNKWTPGEGKLVTMASVPSKDAKGQPILVAP